MKPFTSRQFYQVQNSYFWWVTSQHFWRTDSIHVQKSYVPLIIRKWMLLLNAISHVERGQAPKRTIVVLKKKFQMLFEQNIASNVTRNQESKHITNLNILKEPPSMPMGPQACPSTQNNYLEYKSRRNFIKVLLRSI